MTHRTRETLSFIAFVVIILALLASCNIIEVGFGH